VFSFPVVPSFAPRFFARWSNVWELSCFLVPGFFLSSVFFEETTWFFRRKSTPPPCLSPLDATPLERVQTAPLTTPLWNPLEGFELLPQKGLSLLLSPCYPLGFPWFAFPARWSSSIPFFLRFVCSIASVPLSSFFSFHLFL